MGNGQVSTIRNSFCEEDKEILYNLVQDKYTIGKQRLGISDKPMRIVGVHWKG